MFKSTHTDIVYIESISSKCNVLTFEEYDKIDEPDPNIFFTRASYDPIKQVLSPNFDVWQTSCLCKMPLNPDQVYIKCDRCDVWYHPEHVGVNTNNINAIDEYICPTCELN